MKLIYVALAALFIPATAHAAPQKAVVFSAGRFGNIQAGDTLTMDNISTGTATVVGGVAATIAAPIYSNSVYYSGSYFLSGGISPSAQYKAQQANYTSTDALTIGLTVPSSVTNHQAGAMSAYVLSQRGTYTAGGGDVAGYFQAVAAANNSNVFGINSLVSDTVGFTGQKLQNEFDFNVVAASTSVSGIGAVLNSTVNPASNAFICRIASSSTWNTCFYIPDGSATNAAYFGATGTGNNVTSMPIVMASRSAGGAAYAASVLGDTSGLLLLRGGSASAGVAFQSSTGTTYGYAGSTGITSTALFLVTSAAPTLVSCGTSPVIAAGSTSASGQFTTGTGAPATCTVAFAVTYPTKAYCTVTPASNLGTTTFYISFTNPVGVGITMSAGTSSATFNYNCAGN